MKIFAYTLIFILFLMSFVNAVEMNRFDTTITLYDDGVADITYSLDFDSTNFNDFLYLPAYNPESIITTDNKGEVKYILYGGNILIKPQINTKGYSLKVRYFTNAITNKETNNWGVYYEIPPFSSINFDSAKESTINLILPETSTIIKTSDNAIISQKDRSLNVMWDSKPTKSNPFRVEIIYKTSPSHSKLKEYIITGLIIILASALLIIMFLKISDMYLKKVSKGKKDIIKTLTPKEKEIIELLIKNKGKLTQSNIQKTTGISKATVSRTVKLLQRKNIVEVRPAGNTNYILFTEWFNKK